MMGRGMTEEARNGLCEAMRSCSQSQGLTVQDHGEMVADYYLDLIGHLQDGKALKYEWRLPDWILDPKLIDGLPTRDVMLDYHLFHDVGKPFCRTVDEDGRQHFPDHAAVSERVWRDAGGDEEIAQLIGMDMDMHLLKAEGIEEFASRPTAGALILTALSEIHANASMFGGIESTSFKIKWKHIAKKGKSVLSIF